MNKIQTFKVMKEVQSNEKRRTHFVMSDLKHKAKLSARSNKSNGSDYSPHGSMLTTFIGDPQTQMSGHSKTKTAVSFFKNAEAMPKFNRKESKNYFGKINEK